MHGPLTTLLITGVSSAIAGLASWFAAITNTHGKEKVAKEQTRYPEWKAFVDAIQKETERTKNELTGRINNLQTQVDTLRERVNTLSNKYDAALGHIAEWRRAHPDEIPDRPAPAAIKHDL
ncbi:hypothetical protein [Corynebacterium kroppenstedtii]|uniref:hypothetical protein n=1 Tax=Corynebacterium kroppenstedtii TaxID=161879 RepID=UPI0038730A9B